MPDAEAMLPYLARTLPPIEPRADARDAAVLVLLYPHEGQWHVPLTLRPSHMVDHAGQVSLPGGAIEPGETSAEAAIREFHEELGAADMEVDLLGRLSTRYVMVSNYRVEPWVGMASRRGRLVPDPIEVEQLLEVPLAHLMDPANFGSHQRHRDGVEYTAPHFQFQSHQIWGATCAILGELVTLLGREEL
jgi:8-oxo-dGTP pyrophosphatase MutT (NUDIX family)